MEQPVTVLSSLSLLFLSSLRLLLLLFNVSLYIWVWVRFDQINCRRARFPPESPRLHPHSPVKFRLRWPMEFSFRDRKLRFCVFPAWVDKTLSIPPKHTNPRDDATNLHNAFKGSGSDTAEVINILAHRDATQRAIIQRDYKNLYQEELKKNLSSKLSCHLKKAVLLWMPDPVSRDVTILRHALTGTINDVKAATEVICSRTPFQLRQIKQACYSTYSHNLDHDIGNHTSGDHKKLLLAYVNASRYEGPEIDGTLVEGDALSLYNAGEKKLGTDEKTFISIFSDRSKAHLTAVCSAYHRFGRSLEKAVKHETSGHFRFALLTILRCAENPGRYFAKLLRKAIKGIAGTDDSTLIRIVVTRCEVDLQFIKFAYRKKYGKLLHDSVHSVTSGHYRAFLRALLGPTH